MSHSEEVRRPLQVQSCFHLQVRYGHGNCIDRSLVLFLLGGGGWGYSRCWVSDSEIIMNTEQIIAEIEWLEHLFTLPDERPLQILEGREPEA
jgi:hypothetical protein